MLCDLGSRNGHARPRRLHRESGEFTVLHLKRFISLLERCSNVETGHVIAHSRGTDVLMTAVRELAIHHRATGSSRDPRLHNLILVAADLDVDVSTTRIIAERADQVADRFTLYTSTSDMALAAASDVMHSRKRVGQITGQAIPEFVRAYVRERPEQIAVIRVMKPRGALGHSYFVDDPAVLSDLILLVRDDLAPGAETGRPLDLDPTKTIWLLEPDYPAVEPQ